MSAIAVIVCEFSFIDALTLRLKPIPIKMGRSIASSVGRAVGRSVKKSFSPIAIDTTSTASTSQTKSDRQAYVNGVDGDEVMENCYQIYRNAEALAKRGTVQFSQTAVNQLEQMRGCKADFEVLKSNSKFSYLNEFEKDPMILSVESSIKKIISGNSGSKEHKRTKKDDNNKNYETYKEVMKMMREIDDRDIQLALAQQSGEFNSEAYYSLRMEQRAAMDELKSKLTPDFDAYYPKTYKIAEELVLLRD